MWIPRRRLLARPSNASIYPAAKLLPKGASGAQNNRSCHGGGIRRSDQPLKKGAASRGVQAAEALA